MEKVMIFFDMAGIYNIESIATGRFYSHLSVTTKYLHTVLSC